ncbi:MAG: right-handed parallel beta-helix repeat-containing protein [Myxococcales bacterium]|nr:right-handed parallel beta-helix repeat-containing protein [Myxococcales bacterium]
MDSLRPSKQLASIIVAALTTSASSAAWAADFYVDPQAGSPSGNGSASSPWQTIEQMVSAGLFGTAIQAGDTVHLKSGYHGYLNLTSGSYDPPITIVAATGETPQLRRVRFTNTSGWVLSGVAVSPSFAPSPTTGTMVDIAGGTSKVTVEHCDVFSVVDASGWTESDWMNVASNGFAIGGTDNVVRGNVVTNVRFGISATGDGALVEHNQVINFSADGMRGLGDDETFQYNLVKNSYVSDPPDGNHDDGFQSWSTGPNGPGSGVVTGMVLRGNVFIDHEDPNQPMKGSMQGIGCFDGMFQGWVVENNVVITNHWHGISLYGAIDSRIVNNTVIDSNPGQPGPPWILVNPHKNNTPSQNVVVRNNLATDYSLSGINVTEDHNVTLAMGDFDSYFVDAAHWDLRLLPTAPAVDAGSSDLAPALDADEIPRPQGAAIDLGAYEWHDPSVGPGGAGGMGGEGGMSGTGAGSTTGSGGDGAMGGEMGVGGAGTPTGGAGANAGSTEETSGCSLHPRRSPSVPIEAWGLLLVGLGIAHRRR